VNVLQSLTAVDIAQLGEAASNHVVHGSFSWAECAKQYSVVFDKVLNHTFGKDRSNNHQ